ncbi:MAG: TonB-dependent receptor, partial [Gammaproteobacteria bacterium]|nr:TonB-dependent receptor [Gammaproteobacteria bacterium]
MFDFRATATRLLRPSAVVLPLLILGGAGPALAQQEDDSNAIVIEEIVVTATKRVTDLMSTPIAVSAVTQERLTSQGVSDVTDLGDLVPNMQVGSSPSDSGVQVTVRGITSNNFTELGDPTVAIHVDGMYTPRPQAGLALLHDVGRVEILRGPQGTLFGRNSTSGSINIITAQPDTEALEGNVELDAGRFSRMGARAWINLPVNENVAFRVSGMMEESDSYIQQEADRFDLAFDPDGDGNFEIPADGIPNTDQRRNRNVSDDEAYFAVDRWAARVAMRAYLGDSASWQLTYDYFQDNSPGGLSLKDCEKAAGTFFECDHDQWYARINVPGELDFTIKTLRSEFTWDVLDSVVLEYRVAWSQQDRYQQYDGDAGAWVDPDHPGYGIARFCCGAPPLVRDASAFEQHGFGVEVKFPFEDLQLTTRFSTYKSMVHELQFKSTGDGDLSWIAGAFFMEEENSIRFDVELPFCCAGGVPLAQAFLQPDRGVSTEALFAQFDYAVTERANLTVGYRQTWDEKFDRGGSNH